MPGVQFQNQIDMNAFKVTELAPGVAGTDAVNVNQLNANSPQGFAADIGNGIASSFTISHNFSSFDVIVQVYENSTGNEILADVRRSAEDDVMISFGSVPTVGQYRVLVIPVP
jgi:Coiled stalk of trimeric autotransporter adhesin